MDLLAAIARRARRTVLLEGLFGLLWVGMLAVFWWSAAPHLGLRSPTALMVGLLAGGLAVWGVGLTTVGRYRWASKEVTQARRLERQQPALGGRLLTVAERAGGVRPGESPEVLRWLAHVSREQLGRVDPKALHAQSSWRRGVVFLMAMAVVQAVWWVNSGSTRARLAAYWSMDEPVVALRDATNGETVTETSRVGDVTLRYIYPDYTGLEPYEVPNSTGDVSAPPGTRVEVSVRLQVAASSAALELMGQPAFEATLDEDGRRVSGRFVVGAEPDTWTVLSTVDGEILRSRAFAIQPEPDVAPTVILDGVSGTLEVGLEERLPLKWTVSDDYGIERVFVERNRLVVEPPLRRVRERVAQLSGRLDARPVDLGMLPGETYELVVAAQDNDTVSGKKVGRSEVVRIVVVDGQQRAELDGEALAQLLEAILAPLADFLEEAWPGPRSGPAIARWGEDVGGRYDDLIRLMDEYGAVRRAGMTFAALELAAERGRELVRFTQVGFTVGDSSQASDGALQQLDDARSEAVVTLEDAAILIDRVFRSQAFAQMMEEVDNLAYQADALRRITLAESVDARRVGYEQENTAAQMDALAEAAAELAPGGLRAIVEARVDEANLQLDGLRDALADQAADLKPRTENLAATLDQLASAVREELERRRTEEDEQQQKGKDLVEELTSIAEAQEQEANDLGLLRSESDERRSSDLVALWDALRDATQTLESRWTTVQSTLVKQGRPFDESALLGSSLEALGGLKRATSVRDVTGALDAALDAEQYWEILFQRMQMRAAFSGSGGGQLRTAASLADRELAQMMTALEQLLQISRSEDPTLQAAIRPRVSKQRALQQRLVKARSQANQLAEELPVTPRGMMNYLDEAGDRMEDASGQLAGGLAMQAQGSQAAAAIAVRRAIEALLDAMAASQSSGEASASEGNQPQDGQPGGEEQEGAGRDGEEDPSDEILRIELPTPEEFRTPEAYRRALLEGMEPDVPEEYRALKRRYFEELVRQ